MFEHCLNLGNIQHFIGDMFPLILKFYSLEVGPGYEDGVAEMCAETLGSYKLGDECTGMFLC